MPLVRREMILTDAPTLFLLHGWGSDADDLFSMASPLRLPQSVVALQAPDRHPGGQGWSWFDIGWSERGIHLDTESARARASTLAQVFAGYPRPWTVAGFSQGAMMASLLLAERPHDVDEAILMAGLLLPGVAVASGPRRRTLVTHGRADEVVPYSEGERMARELSQHHDVTFVPDPDGHGVSMAQLVAIGAFLSRD